MTDPTAVPGPPAPELAPKPKAKVFARWVIAFIAAGCVVGTAAGVGLALVFASYSMAGGSMWPTFAVGERVFANRLAKDPERGAIMVMSNGDVTINGWKVPRFKAGEYFVLGDNRRNSHDSATWRAEQGAEGAGAEGAGAEGAGAEGAGRGVSLADTVGRVRGYEAPALRTDLEGLAQLGPALEACLVQRPKETTPPPPKSAAR